MKDDNTSDIVSFYEDRVRLNKGRDADYVRLSRSPIVDGSPLFLRISLIHLLEYDSFIDINNKEEAIEIRDHINLLIGQLWPEGDKS